MRGISTKGSAVSVASQLFRRRTIAIVQHAMTGAPHWYVISDDLEVHEKFNHLEDAKEFALQYALPENIEVSDH